MTSRSTDAMFYVITILALAITQSLSFAILPDDATLTIPDITRDGINDLTEFTLDWLSQAP